MNIKRKSFIGILSAVAVVVRSWIGRILKPSAFEYEMFAKSGYDSSKEKQWIRVSALMPDDGKWHHFSLMDGCPGEEDLMLSMASELSCEMISRGNPPILARQLRAAIARGW
jgi:hypothetical protein